jgi:hypothetical protein
LKSIHREFLSAVEVFEDETLNARSTERSRPSARHRTLQFNKAIAKLYELRNASRRAANQRLEPTIEALVSWWRRWRRTLPRRLGMPRGSEESGGKCRMAVV